VPPELWTGQSTQRSDFEWVTRMKSIHTRILLIAAGSALVLYPVTFILFRLSLKRGIWGSAQPVIAEYIYIPLYWPLRTFFTEGLIHENEWVSGRDLIDSALVPSDAVFYDGSSPQGVEILPTKEYRVLSVLRCHSMRDPDTNVKCFIDGYQYTVLESR